MDQLSLETFQGCEGRSFWAMTDQGTEVAFILQKVEPLTAHKGHPLGDAARTPFSLVLKGPQGVALEQGMVNLKSDLLGDGAMSIFIVAIGKAEEEGCLTYQAVFN